MIDEPVKTRRDLRREETYEEIKATARRHMREGGTASLSLRAIAAEMKMTAPAIYRYFENRDALITALIVDAFNALADALETARVATPSADPVERLMAVLMAYRAWAVENPVDFQLVYGNPIPGYEAPREVTVPAVIRSFVVIVGLIEEALRTARYTPQPPYDAVPAPLQIVLQAMIERDGYPVSEMALYLGIAGWTQIHGIISLEVYGHLGPVVGDLAAFYRSQVNNMLRAFGVN